MATSISRKGIYLLPHVLTTLSIACGFFSVTSAASGHAMIAAHILYLGMIFDVLDGRVARLMQVASVFGKAYDCVADMITFGLAPAFLSYSLLHPSLGRMAWLVSFSYLAATALRLARYNSDDDHFDFCGLPCPAAAAMLVSVIWVMRASFEGVHAQWFALLVVIMACLQISQIPYRGIKRVRVSDGLSLVKAFVLVLALGAIWLAPSWTLLAIFSGYTLSGLWIMCRQKCSRI